MKNSILTMLIIILILFASETACGNSWIQPDSGESVREYYDFDKHFKIKVGKKNFEDNSYFELINWPDSNSASMKINLGINPTKIEFRNDTTCIDYPSFNAKFYFKDLQNESLEWEIILNSKPIQTSFSFPIQYNNLIFYYQDSLGFDPVSCYRPDSVWFSYAVYHTHKKNNSYKTGKAFHIYRPKAWDASGDTAWLVLNIDTLLNVFTIAGDNEWFKDADYPVTIDPTIGFTNAGASEISGLLDDVMMYYYDASAAVETANLDSVYLCCRETGFASVGVYLENEGPETWILTAFSDSFEIPAAEYCEWISSGNIIMDNGLISGLKYCPALMINNEEARIAFDEAGLYEEVCSPKRTSLADWPDPFGEYYDGNRRYSVYVVYGLDSVGTSGGPLRRKKIILEGL